MTAKTVDEATAYVAVPTEERNLDECDYQNLEDPIEIPPAETEGLDMSLFSAFKIHSLIFGLLIGFFVQFSTLGANFLVITLWDNAVVVRNNTDLILLSLSWSAFTSFMALLTLGFLRSIITKVFKATIPPEQRGPATDALLDEVVVHLECRFVVGALVGVCSAWTAMDVFLGMKMQIVLSLGTLVVSLIWIKVMMMCCAKDESSLVLVHDKKEEEKVNLV